MSSVFRLDERGWEGPEAGDDDEEDGSEDDEETSESAHPIINLTAGQQQ